MTVPRVLTFSGVRKIHLVVLWTRLPDRATARIMHPDSTPEGHTELFGGSDFILYDLLSSVIDVVWREIGWRM